MVTAAPKTQEGAPEPSQLQPAPDTSLQESPQPVPENPEPTPQVSVQALAEALKTLDPDTVLALFPKEKRMASKVYAEDVKAATKAIEDRADWRAQHQRESEERRKQREADAARIEEQLQSGSDNLNYLAEARKLAGLRETTYRETVMDDFTTAIVSNQFWSQVPEEKVNDLNRLTGNLGKWASGTLDTLTQHAYESGVAAGAAKAEEDFKNRVELTEAYVRQKLAGGDMPPDLPGGVSIADLSTTNLTLEQAIELEKAGKLDAVFKRS